MSSRRPVRPAPPTLAKQVGGLPLPPKIGKPPSPRVAKPLQADALKASAARPHMPHTLRAAPSQRDSVAGRLGTFGGVRGKIAPPGQR